MAGVRGDRQDFPLITIKTIGVESGVLVPERLVETAAQRLGLFPQASRLLVEPEMDVDIGHPAPCVEDVALEFAKRLRPSNGRTVDIHHGVASVLPPLVLVAPFGTRLVFLETVAVPIAVFVDPR